MLRIAVVYHAKSMTAIRLISLDLEASETTSVGQITVPPQRKAVSELYQIQAKHGLFEDGPLLRLGRADQFRADSSASPALLCQKMTVFLLMG